MEKSLLRTESAAPRDYAELTQVWEASVRATHRFLQESDIQEIKSRMAGEYLPGVERLRCIREEGRIVAFIGLAGTHIAMLFVRPDRRGTGCGRRLVEEAVARYGARTVDTNEQNEQATGFYLRLGFAVVGRDERDDAGRPFPILHLALRKG